MINPMVLLAIGILIGAIAASLIRTKAITPTSIARFTFRLTMFPFQVSHDAAAILHYRLYELVTGVRFDLQFERRSRKG